MINEKRKKLEEKWENGKNEARLCGRETKWPDRPPVSQLRRYNGAHPNRSSNLEE